MYTKCSNCDKKVWWGHTYITDEEGEVCSDCRFSNHPFLKKIKRRLK